MRRRSSKRGYTAVEVLIAMTLFAIGAAGVVGMQRTIVQGGNDARHFDLGSNIAHMMLGRLQQDAMGWTLPSQLNPTGTNLATTRYLNVLGTSCSVNWCAFPSVPAPHSGSFDMWGRDMGPSVPPNIHEFCAQYKVNFLSGGIAAPPGTLIKAEVRVLWSRIDRRPIENCNASPLLPGDPDGAGANNYHSIYVATTLRPNTWQ